MAAPNPRTIDRSEPVRELDSFDAPDYADAHGISMVEVERRSAEQWARAIVEGVLESRSPFLTAHLITAVGDTTVTQSTSVRDDRRGAAIGWRPAVLLHRRILPSIVRHAVAQAPPR